MMCYRTGNWLEASAPAWLVSSYHITLDLLLVSCGWHVAQECPGSDSIHFLEGPYKRDFAQLNVSRNQIYDNEK